MWQVVINIPLVLFTLLSPDGGIRNDINYTAQPATTQIAQYPSKMDSVNGSRSTLKALVIYSPTSYFMYRGKIMGFEYELLERLAKNLKMELEVIVCNDVDSLIPYLQQGKADIIAHGLTITPQRKEKVSFTDKLFECQPVLIQRKPNNWRQLTQNQLDDKLIRSSNQLVGDTISIRKNSSYKERIDSLNNKLGNKFYINLLDGSYSTDKIIDMVNEEDIKYTIADDYKAKILTAFTPSLDINTPLSSKQKIAWAVRKESKNLLNSLNRELRQAKKKVDYYVIFNKYFKNRSYFKQRIKSPFYSLSNNQISEYDDLIKQSADRIGWDWRLLASLIYQESRFNPEAQSWAGAKGLMQMMPETAKMLGLEDAANPEKNIIAGSTYLQKIYNRFKNISDENQRIKFTLASYNSGYGHILDAQRLAKANGKDPNTWDDSVDMMILALQNPEIYHKPEVRYGYAMGKETYNYVSEIYQRYGHYSFFIK